MKEDLILEQLAVIEESGNYTVYHCMPIIFPGMVDLSYRDDCEYPCWSYERLRNLFFPSLNRGKTNLTGREEILVNRRNWHLEKKMCSVYNLLEGPVWLSPHSSSKLMCRKVVPGKLEGQYSDLVALCRPASGCCSVVRVCFKSTI